MVTAMPWPSRSSRSSTNPDTLRPVVALAVVSSAALFSAPVKDEFFRHLPTSSSPMPSVPRRAEQRDDGDLRRPERHEERRPSASRARGLRRRPPTGQARLGTIGKIARYGDIPSLLQRPRQDRRVFMEVDGVRYVMPGDFATVEHDGSVTLLGRARCDQLGGEKIFPKRSSPRCARIPTCSTPSSSAPDERWGRRCRHHRPARAAPPPSSPSRTTAARASPATSCRVASSPSNHPAVPERKPDYRWPTDRARRRRAPDAG